MHLGIQFDRAILTHREKPAFIDQGRTTSYAELGCRATRFANALLASGVVKGDRLAILAPNCVEAVVTDGAVMKTGIVKVPLNARISANELQTMIADSGSSVLVTHVDLLALAREVAKRCPGLRVIAVGIDGDEPAGWADFERFEEQGSDVPVAADIGKDDLYKLKYTSGTSGVLKAAMLTHGNWLCLTRTYLMRRGLRKAPTPVAAYIAPITHAAGGSILASMLVGATNLLLRKFDPADFLRSIEEYRISEVLLVPAMINMLLESPELQQRDLSSLDDITYGTAPMSPERIRQALAAFGPVLTQGYGQTECCAVLSQFSSSDHLAVHDPALAHRLVSAGMPSFEVEVRIVDDEGVDVPVGEIGEIVVRGDCVMRGYWNAPELTADTIRDGWLHTRDMGRLDADGYLYLVDRKSDMIISGGFNIYPAEVENSLYEHPAVYEVAVVSVPDPKWGETVKAVVVLKENMIATEEELIAHSRSLLANFKAPRSIDFVNELPKSGVGKILRRVVKEKYWEGMKRRIS